MNIENKALISELLSMTVKENGVFEFNKSKLYADASEYTKGSMVNGFLLESEADIIFLNLDPQYNYNPNNIDLEGLEGDVLCQCYSDKQQLIVALQWGSQPLSLGYLGAHPSNSKRFPQAGYMALALLKEKLKHKPAEYLKAEKGLFDAVGKACFPSSDNAGAKAKKIYVNDLSKHDKKGTFPLRGAPLQQGERFFMNGGEYIFTAYGISEIHEEFYGDSILDAAINFEQNGGCCIIRIKAHCNGTKGNEVITTMDSLKPGFSYSLSELGPVFAELKQHYDDFDLIFNLNTAALSVIHFDHIDLTYMDSWNEASMLIASALNDYGVDDFTLEKRYL